MNHHQFCKLMVIVAVVSTALWTSLAGLAGLAQAAPTPDQVLTMPAVSPANLPLLAAGPFTVTKSSVNEGDIPLRPGERVTYTITIFNSGDQDATNVVVSDTFPSNTSFVPNSIEITPAGTPGTQPTLAEGILITALSSVTVTYAVTINSNVADGTEIINTASVTSTELSDPTSASVTDIVVTEADLSLSKSGSPDPVLVGNSLTYSLIITNAGPSVAANVIVTDTLPPTVNFSPAPGCSASSGVVTCAIGDLNSGATETVTLVVTPTIAGELTNQAAVSSAASDPDGSNNNATVTTTVNPKADLVIRKSDEPEAVIAGETITYTLTITNNGPSPADNVVISDTLPLSLSLQSVSPATSTQSGQQLSWNVGSIAMGDTRTFTIVARVGGDVRNSIQNTASVSSSTFDPAPGNNSDTEITTVNTEIDLSLTKTDTPDPAAIVGNNIQYTLTISNSGPSDATGVVVTDTLPVGMFYVGAVPGICNNSSGIVTCNFGNIAKNTNAQVTITVDQTQAGVFTNTATVGANEPDSNSLNNTDTETTSVNTADLVLTKTDAPDPVLVGNPLTYILTVQNQGPNPAIGVTLSDILPASVTFKSFGGASCTQVSGTVTCDLGNMNNGDARNVTIVVTPTVAAVISNTASVVSTNPDPIPANNTSTINTIVNPVADLVITKSDTPDPVTAGTSLTYTLTITNNGPSEATDVVITDTLPASAAIVSVSGFCSSQPNNQVRCTYDSIANGSAAPPAIIRVTVNPAAPNLITNTASVTSNEFDPNTNNNSATTSTTVNRLVNLSITKIGSPNPVAAGNSLNYTLTVANSGPSQASGVIITDTLPAGVTFSSAPGCSNSSNKVICNLGAISSGGTVTASIAAAVASSTFGTITNTATVTSTEPDSNTANNKVTITTTVTRVTDLAITQSSTPNPVTAGNNISFNLTVINNGPSDATNVTVNNTLPAGVAFQSVTPALPTCSHTNGIVTCNLGGMVNGSSVPIVIVAKVNTSTSGNIINMAEVTVSGSSDPVSENNSTSAPAFVGDLFKVFLPVLMKPVPTDLFIENDTGGAVTFSVVGTGVSCNVPAGNQNFFCGSFPPGSYTVQVSSICGNLATSKLYNSGPQSTRVFCN